MSPTAITIEARVSIAGQNVSYPKRTTTLRFQINGIHFVLILEQGCQVFPDSLPGTGGSLPDLQTNSGKALSEKLGATLKAATR